MSHTHSILSTLLVLQIGCGNAAPVEPVEPVAPEERSAADVQIDWMIENTANYLENREWRRAELEASLWRPDLQYAKKRLDAYALEGRGWDLLPEFDVVSTTVGENPTTTELDPTVPTTREAWLELGEQVFWLMPLRRDAYLEWVLKQPAVMAEVGLQTDERGNVRGVVEFVDGYGDVRQGATCSVCHSSNGVAGQSNADLDIGRARVLFGEEFGIDNSVYGTWGPGTVDVTDDGVSDALAIPSLWNIEHQRYLNASGGIELASPATLAIRFETQVIVGHSMLERPKRVYIWAMAMFVLSLDAATEPATHGPGFEVFEQACAACHHPEQAFGGELIDARALNSDEQAAHSVFRGTGYYRTSTLLGISRAGQFMHDAKITSLEQLIDSGHPFGLELDDDRQRDLLDFLHTL